MKIGDNEILEENTQSTGAVLLFDTSRSTHAPWETTRKTKVGGSLCWDDICSLSLDKNRQMSFLFQLFYKAALIGPFIGLQLFIGTLSICCYCSILCSTLKFKYFNRLMHLAYVQVFFFCRTFRKKLMQNPCSLSALPDLVISEYVSTLVSNQFHLLIKVLRQVL